MSTKIVQGLWIGERLSIIEQLSISSFIKNGHEYHLYVYDDVKGIPDSAIVKDANEIIPDSEIFYLENGPGKGSVAAFSDIFRYKLIHDRGGYWVDSDFVCLRFLDFTDEYVFSSEHIGDNKTAIVNAGVIKAPRQSGVIKYCLEKSTATDRGSLDWGDIGPKLIKESIIKHELTQFVQLPVRFCPIPYQWLANFLVVDRSLFNLDGVYMIHLWNEQWRRHKIDKNGTFPENTLFEYLKKTYL